MLSFPTAVRIFVAQEAVDFRKAHDGLCAIIRDEFGDDPLSGHWFVFFNKSRNRIKLLVFDQNGFWLHYKRLERGTFQRLPHRTASNRKVEVSARDLSLLLQGIDLQSSRIRKHFASSIRLTSRGRESWDATSYRAMQSS